MASFQPPVQTHPIVRERHRQGDAAFHVIEEGAALYVHVPFCRLRCPYCDFATAPYRDASAARFVEAVLREAQMLSPSFKGVVFESLFFGGGTPSRLAAEGIAKLIGGLRENFEFGADIECSLEANPEDVDDSRIEAWTALGINRVSLGVQSFCARDLERLGRVHGRAGAESAARQIKRSFPNWSLDLIFGFPDHTADAWTESLERAVELSPPHVSIYNFTAEKGTPMGDSVNAGRVQAAGDDEAALMFDVARDRLLSSGLCHYEISNYALRGHECRHNLTYWQRRAHLGLGPSAVSLWGARRWKNLRDAAHYSQAVLTGKPWIEEEEDLNGKETLEAIMLGLRLEDGVLWDRLPGTPESQKVWREACRSLIEEGWIEATPGGMRIPQRGRRLTDSIILKLWQLAEPGDRSDQTRRSLISTSEEENEKDTTEDNSRG